PQHQGTLAYQWGARRARREHVRQVAQLAIRRRELPALHELPKIVDQGMALRRRAFYANGPVGRFWEGPGIRLGIGAPVDIEGIRRPGTRGTGRNLHVQPHVVRYWGSETKLTPQGPLGAIGKGDIAAVPGDSLGTYGKTTRLRFQASYLAGVIDLGAG